MLGMERRRISAESRRRSSKKEGRRGWGKMREGEEADKKAEGASKRKRKGKCRVRKKRRNENIGISERGRIEKVIRGKEKGRAILFWNCVGIWNKNMDF